MNIKNTLMAGMLASVLAVSGCSLLDDLTTKTNVPAEVETEQTEQVLTFDVTENAYYFPPDNPTSYIASTYNALTDLLPTVTLEVDASAETEQTESADGAETVEEVEETIRPEDMELPAVTADDLDVAEACVKYFIADFFTLKNKEDENDIGALDLIPSDSASAFVDYAKYYYYDSLPVIKTQEGTAQLPEVTSVTLAGPQEVTVEYLGSEYTGYTFAVQIEYAESTQASEFKTSCKCTIIKMQDVHYIDRADVTSDRLAGIPHEVWRITAVSD